MTMPPAIEGRVSRLEQTVTDGLSEIKELIVREIQELKNEQLGDIKKSIDRVEKDLKGEHTRLADDQRRLWDQVNGLLYRENQRIGAGNLKNNILHVCSVLVGGLITAGATFVLQRGPLVHP
jgi:hypothetical protein